MTTWMIDNFLALLSQDESKVNQAHFLIIASFEQPETMFQMIDLMKSIDHSSIQIIEMISFAILDMLRKKVNSKECLDFFSADQILLISNELFSLLFSLDFSIRKHILECMRFIIVGKIDSTPYLENVFSILNESDFLNSVTALSFFEKWIKYIPQSKHIIEEKHNEFSAFFIPVFINILNEANNFIPEQQGLDAFILITSILEKLIEQSDSMQDHPQFVDLIQIICSSLLIEIVSPEISMMKSKIIDFIAHSLIMHFSNPNSVRASKQRFSIFFREEIVPNLTISVLQAFSFCKDQLLAKSLFFLIYILLSKNLSIDIICTIQFVQEILFPFTLLTEEDLLLFDEIPEQYLFFNIQVENVDFSLRNQIQRVIYAFRINMPFVQHLIEVMLAESSSHLELEAKLFILSCITTIHPLQIDIIENLFPVFSDDSPLFLVAAALNLATNVGKSYQDKLSIAVHYIMACEHPVVEVSAIYLMIHSLSKLTKNNPVADLEIGVSLEDLIKKVLSLAIRVGSTAPAELIHELLDIFPSEFSTINGNLIIEIMNLWNIRAASFDNDEDKSLGELLVTISNVICHSPLNDPVMFSLIDPIIEFVINGLTNYYELGVNVQLVDIVGALADQFDNPPDSLFRIVSIFKYLIEDEKIAGINEIKEYATVLTSLICSPRHVEACDGQFIAEICDLCKISLEKTDIDLFVHAVFLILCGIIQAESVDINEILPTVFDFIFKIDSFEDYQLSFIAAISCISSSILVDPQKAISLIPPIILDYWIQYSSYIEEADIKYIRMSVIALLTISQLPNQNAYSCALHQLKVLAGEDDSYDDYSSNEDVMNHLATCKLPLDRMNFKDILVSKLNETNCSDDSYDLRLLLMKVG